MNVRDIIDSIRNDFIDSEDAPTRVITYTRSSDDVSVYLNTFIGSSQFKEDENERIEDYITCNSLKLLSPPQVNDKITYDGQTYKVVRYSKIGQLYNVFGKIARHNGRPKR